MASPSKKSFLLRIDPALWGHLERLAAAELRSVNAQIEFLLREGVARRSQRSPSAPPAATSETPTLPDA